ncbi:hypothetical protein Lesp02_41490 [Lentzea sp. NBRC 105346]|uniref:YbaB/EbfC family nucleoid-associated protein n=1 Tax=Lentzea sp. NBRC 105346 TaxID=3032205 RepID=UPI0024A54A48|nr:YbaB/EbfC family nucleoid-associated protein [Lentzea sp. NBRC 105346]GLZ31961.1 hypothetical protein Lesp02_41490 [Lentzea sp. NBRC 105346]
MSGPTANGNLSSTAGVDQWVARARAKAERYQEMKAQAGQISVTETSRDGLVTVSIDSSGNVTDMRITDQVRELSGAEVAAAVLMTMRRAQAKLPEKLAEVMAATIGDDAQTVDTIVGNYRAKFPEPPSDEPQPPGRPAPRPANDDDDFGGESVMNEE